MKFPDFKAWILKYLLENNERGKLADDILMDDDFPRGVIKSDIESYLLDKGTPIETMDVFHCCWDQYKELYGVWFSWVKQILLINLIG